jgi:thiol-disulfide isomerase/thioredoxin
MKKILSCLLLTGALVSPTGAADLGDAAAPLKISEWIKGKPVDLAAAKGKQVIVVEFWATWCGPCRTSIPHLTEMQKKFKDVVLVGISDEESDTVRKFVTKMGEKMDYVVALDDDKQTSAGYMRAYGVNGIPHAFIVDKDGKMVWHGHPMSGLDKALEQIVAGKYDLDAEKAKAKKQAAAAEQQKAAQKKMQQLAQMITEGRNDEATAKLEAELIALDAEVGGLMGGRKFDPADFRKAVLFNQKLQDYQRAAMDPARSNDLASLEKDLQTDAPPGFDLAEYKQGLAAQMESRKAMPVLESYLEAVGENGDATKAAELAKKVEALDLKNPELLNQIAWVILTGDMVKHRDLKLAVTLSKKAVDASEAKNAGIIDTYARALFESGNVTEAIAQQQKAVNLAEDEEVKKELTATLKKYQNQGAAKPPVGT